MKKYISVAIRVFISLVLIVYLFSQQDFGKIWMFLKTYRYEFLIAGLGLQVIGTYVSSMRWAAILKTSGYEVPTKNLFFLYTKGYFFNNFLPTQMGGDVYKSYNLGTQIDNQSVALFSVFMDRFGGLVVLLLLGLFGIGSLYGLVGVVGALVLVIIGLAVYFPVLNIAAKKVKFLNKFKEASDLFMKDKENGLKVLGLSVLVQLISFSLVYVLFLGMDIGLPLWAVLAYMPIVSLSLLIPSFNGFGTQETVYAFLFKSAGVTEPISIAVSLLMHCVRLLMSLLGGLFLLFKIEK
ncbi:MAG: flippase-like domain-containing protein [Niabella sp.]|nr:MAG: flippase-like domain-containing protein [Niabella sp.]